MKTVKLIYGSNYYYRHRIQLISALVVFGFGCIPLSTLAIDLDQVKELNCIRPQPDVARNVDFRWMLSINRWYIPLQSKLNFYRMAETLLETPISDLTDLILSVNASCLTYKYDSVSPKLYGGGMAHDEEEKVVSFITNPVYENSFGFKGHWTKAKRGRSYITLKDNKSFVFFTTCWEDEESSWQVISTEKSLGEEIKKEIIAHAKSLNFKDDNIFEQDYSSCTDFNNLNNLKDKIEL